MTNKFKNIYDTKKQQQNHNKTQLRNLKKTKKNDVLQKIYFIDLIPNTKNNETKCDKYLRKFK